MKLIRNIWFNDAMIFLSLPWFVVRGQADTVCFNDTILYEVTAPKNATLNWNIEGGTMIYSSEKKDSVIVVWNKDQGSHSIEVTKHIDNACPGEPKAIEVFVYRPSIDLGGDMTICEGSQEIISIDPVYEEYLWNNQAGNHEFKVSSEGRVMLEVKDKYGCWAKDGITVTENERPMPDFTVRVDTMNSSVSFINLSDSLWRYHWYFGDGSFSDDYNPGIHHYTDTGKYEISLTAQNNGCLGVMMKEVHLPEYFTSDFDAVYQGCAPVEVSFVNRSTGADNYYWELGNGGTAVGKNPKVVYKKAGAYEVSLTAEKGKIKKVSKKSVVIDPAPVADFDINPAEPVIFEDIRFLNKSLNAHSYLWDFGDGEFSELYGPDHSYPVVGEYDIVLQVWSENGCYDSVLVKNAVKVTEDCALIFPTGFVPDKNGASGGHYNQVQQETDNDIFHPLYKNIGEYELKIYNRWGVLVFVSNDINIGWDGYYNGNLAPQDTYLYTVKAICTFGKTISRTGSITLIY